MSDSENYKNLINDIIAKQMVILGPAIVLMKAKNVSSLSFDAAGKVTRINGDPQQALQQLVDQYIGLSGQIVKNILVPVFAKYPEIKLKI